MLGRQKLAFSLGVSEAVLCLTKGYKLHSAGLSRRFLCCTLFYYHEDSIAILCSLKNRQQNMNIKGVITHLKVQQMWIFKELQPSSLYWLIHSLHRFWRQRKYKQAFTEKETEAAKSRVWSVGNRCSLHTQRMNYSDAEPAESTDTNTAVT